MTVVWAIGNYTKRPQDIFNIMTEDINIVFTGVLTRLFGGNMRYVYLAVVDAF